MSELLKSCPFCGGEARYVEGFFSCDGRADRPFIALCTNCDARIELMPKWSEFNPYSMSGCEEEMRKMVLEEWNTRADSGNVTCGQCKHSRTERHTGDEQLVCWVRGTHGEVVPDDGYCFKGEL